MRGIVSLLTITLATGLVASAANAGEEFRGDNRDGQPEVRRDEGKHDEGKVEGKVTSLLYTCSVSFTAKGKSIYLGLGFTGLRGDGMIACYDYRHHTTQHIPIKVTARGPGAGLGITGLVVSGGATGIGLIRGPEALLGRYLTVRAGASAGVGVGASAGIHLSHDSFVVDASVQAQGGLGAGVDILSVDMELDTDHAAYTDNAPLTDVVGPAPALAPPVAVAPDPIVEPAIPVVTVPVKVLYVSENQPVHLVDAQGRLLQVIYLRTARK
jgi:hypothetical protein